VQWAVQNGVPFSALSGGHGTSANCTVGSNGIIINMRKLNSVEVDLKKGQVVIGGGAIVKELLTAAKASKAHVGQ
jgi:FAD/FMN-containing dehydrogenase